MFQRQTSLTSGRSDFLEESTNHNRLSRQSRLTAPLPAPGTAKKYGTRQTRFTNSLARSGSLDRANGSAYLSAPNAGRLSRTPQRAINYDTDKIQRQTGALHNDKKWVAERTQRISEYLEEAVHQGKINNISPDLFTRTGGLRQMSIKQFVAIVNYFLNFIGRFQIGTNHVEDIIKVLQKLRYPYQVNKSWLKTPNTQHSFGNVIVLFDYFMNFLATDKEYEFQDPSELITKGTMEKYGVTMQALDSDFQLQLIRDAKEGYLLWDKEVLDECQLLKEQTCDALIMKYCNIPNYAALEKELVQLKTTLKDLEKQLPTIPRNEEKYNCDLKEQLTKLLEQGELLKNESEMLMDSNKLLQMQLRKIEHKIVEVEKCLAEMKYILQNQRMNIEERDKLIDELDEQKHMIQTKERTIRVLQEQYHHQQILLARSKKKITDRIEQYNLHINELVMLCNIQNYDQLKLTRHVDQKTIDIILPQLISIKDGSLAKIKDYLNRTNQLDQEISEMDHIISAQLTPKHIALEKKHKTNETLVIEIEEAVKKERKELNIFIQEQYQLYEESEMKIQQLRQLCMESQQYLEQLSTENEKNMIDLEKQYNDLSGKRKENLEKREKELKKATENLRHLEELVQNLESVMLKQENTQKMK